MNKIELMDREEGLEPPSYGTKHALRAPLFPLSYSLKWERLSPLPNAHIQLIILCWQTVIVIVNDRNPASRLKMKKSVRPTRTTVTKAVKVFNIYSNVKLVRVVNSRYRPIADKKFTILLI